MGNACSQRANCTVSFDSTNTNATVLALGGVERGNFDADPDIAGIGTVAALLAGTAVGLLAALAITIGLILDRIPKLVEYSYNSFLGKNGLATNQLFCLSLQCLHPWNSSVIRDILPIQDFTIRQATTMGILLTRGRLVPTWDDGRLMVQGSPGPEKGKGGLVRNNLPSYDVLEAILFCIHDSQLLLAIALGLSFHLGTNCSTSQYHLDIAMNLSLIGCVGFLLAFTLVRNYWAAPIASGIRIACFMVVLYFISITINNQLNAGLSPEYEPPSSRNDSLILLEAACFLNKTYSIDLNSTIGNHTELVGRVDEKIPIMSYHKFIWAIGIVSIASALFRIYQLIRHGTDGPARKTRGLDGDESLGFRSTILVIWWSAVWVGCLVIYIWTVWHVLTIREWVSDSGWIQPDDFSSNPENDVRSFGQIAAVVASESVAIAAFDRWKPGWWKSWVDNGDE
ncbi:hypothetical protein F53441_12782 [Fusarium austroafricanum]|uniref:Uncharacterized protein n=1 Tax=Fusarium austroafricanum TaxID=2364996 RepID=A0A8H4NNI3_9HYPO|nr:hypothetical protein F53441_12782 [Fusarium austroafricanum]